MTALAVLSSWTCAELLAFAVPHHLRDRGRIVVMTSIQKAAAVVIIVMSVRIAVVDIIIYYYHEYC